MSSKHNVKLKDRHMRKDKPRTPKQQHEKRKNEANTVKESKQ